MSRNYPDWATDKQCEGMSDFINIADEFGSFDIGFIQVPCGSDHEFTARVSWIHHGDGASLSHDFRIAFEHTQMWDSCGEELHEWQFVFADGDIAHPMEMSIFYIDLFHFMNNRKPEPK